MYENLTLEEAIKIFTGKTVEYSEQGISGTMLVLKVYEGESHFDYSSRIMIRGYDASIDKSFSRYVENPRIKLVDPAARLLIKSSYNGYEIEDVIFI